MIQVNKLHKTYHNKKVVNNLSFHIKEGEAFALLGSNGAGKSTTIKTILGLVKADTGDIKIAEGKRLGYSPETPSFPPFMTGSEVLNYYAKLQKENTESVSTLLETVGLEPDRIRVKNYSKGMLQRLALAQALLGNPEILLLDEPCAGLDALGRFEMLGLLKKLKTTGKTILINSHILSDIETVCDRGIIMNKGALIKEWSKEDIGENQTLETIFIETLGGTSK